MVDAGGLPNFLLEGHHEVFTSSLYRCRLIMDYVLKQETQISQIP